MKKRKFTAAVFLSLFLCGCTTGSDKITEQMQQTETSDNNYIFSDISTAAPLTEESVPAESTPETVHGNAHDINGKTVFVSIFANDTETSWDYEKEDEVRTMYQTLSYLQIAADWLKQQIDSYGGNAEFVLDWETNQDLFYGANFYQQMIREDSTCYNDQKYFIEKYIDSDSIMEKYNADNILYLFFFNSSFSNQANSCASPPVSIYGEKYSTEFINIFVRFDDTHIASPSVYAHEILHAFGAHDLYYANNAISEEYVNYCIETNSNDIMYTVSDDEVIINELSELDAYYIGLVDSSEDVTKWNLMPSEYE